MERIVHKAAINMMEVNQLVGLPQLLEHRVVYECVALFIFKRRRRRARHVFVIYRSSKIIRRCRRRGHNLQVGNYSSRTWQKQAVISQQLSRMSVSRESKTRSPAMAWQLTRWETILCSCTE